MLTKHSLKNLAIKLGLISSKSKAKFPNLLEQVKIKLENDPRNFIVDALCLEMQKEKSGVLSFPFSVKASATCGSNKQRYRSCRPILLTSSSAFKPFSSIKKLLNVLVN
jgi:hypothetical protein